MKLSQVVQEILKGKNLENKLVDVKNIEFDQIQKKSLVTSPERNQKLKFSNLRKKFPKNLEKKEAKAYALHCFANHELLAIEIMAYVLAFFPHDTKEMLNFKKSVLGSLQDEQKHLKLYQERVEDLGFEIGDFPMNDFFWKYVPQIKKPNQYIAMMSLTFEAANLDFSYYYYQIFEKIEDHCSAKVMKKVFDDEISHVKLGVHFANLWRQNQSLWNYYNESLCYPLTPARSKGINFNSEFRRLVGLDEKFIYELKNFDDNYQITKRKKR